MRPIGGWLTGGIAGGNPGTTKAFGSYIDWARYSTSLRPGTRLAALAPIPPRSGNRSAPVLPTVWQVRQTSLALHDPAADLDHVGRGHLASESRLLGRLHFFLRHHLADIGIEPGRREDERADPDGVRDRHTHRGTSSPEPLHARSRGPQGPAPLAWLARCARSQQNLFTTSPPSRPALRRGLRGVAWDRARNRAGRAGSRSRTRRRSRGRTRARSPRRPSSRSQAWA